MSTMTTGVWPGETEVEPKVNLERYSEPLIEGTSRVQRNISENFATRGMR
jgi:hypothetical protein